MFIRRTDRGALANWWFTVDHKLLGAFFLLMAIGLLINMASSPAVATRIGLDPFHFIKRQIIFMIPAFGVLLFMSFLSVKAAKRASVSALAFSLVLVFLTLQIGAEIKGATRWINVGSIAIQPSELLKPAFIVVAAFFFAEKLLRPEMPGNLIAVGLLGIVVALLILQPDYGQTILICTVWAIMFLATGVPWIWIFGLAGLGAIGLFVAYLTVHHVASRIDRFLQPDGGDTYQVDMARDAFERGGLIGAGPGGGSIKNIIPDAHSDFTFAVAGEEFGAIACIVLLAIYGYVVWRGLAAATKEGDPFRRLAITGLVSLFGLQAIINMGVNVALLPAKGMTLPFVSYGGSSLLSMAFAMGLVLAFSRRRAAGHVASGLDAPVLGHAQPVGGGIRP